MKYAEHPIVCAVDSSFVIPGLVLFDSIVQHGDPAAFTFYLIDMGLAETDARRVRTWAAARKASLHVVPTPLTGSRRDAPPSFQALMKTRMQALDGLMQKLDRALFLDADLLVASDLRPLFETPMDGHALAAVRDMGHFTFGEAFPYGVTGLGGDPSWPYYNIGVLLVDGEGWRTRSIGARCTELMEQVPPEVQYLCEQDLYHLLVDGAFADLHPTWNAQMIALQHHDKWPETDLKQAVAEHLPGIYEHPNILHWPGPYKPWQDHPGCDIPHQARYREAMAMTCSAITRMMA